MEVAAEGPYQWAAVHQEEEGGGEEAEPRSASIKEEKAAAAAEEIQEEEEEEEEEAEEEEEEEQEEEEEEQEQEPKEEGGGGGEEEEEAQREEEKKEQAEKDESNEKKEGEVAPFDVLERLALQLFDPKSGLPLKSHYKGLHRWENSFKGKNCVQWLMLNRLVDQKAAVQLGEMLRKAGWIYHRSGKTFQDSNRWFVANIAALRRSQPLTFGCTAKCGKKKHKKKHHHHSNDEDAKKAEALQVAKQTDKPTKQKHKKPHRHVPAKLIARKQMAVAGAGGGFAGAGVGIGVGLLGGPFAPVTIPLGALVGGVVGAVVGIGSGGASAAYLVHQQALKEVQEMEDVPIHKFLTTQEQLEYYKMLLERVSSAQGHTTNDAFVFPPRPVYEKGKEPGLQADKMDEQIALFKSILPQRVSEHQVKGVLYNFRDLSTAVTERSAPIALYENRIFRSACISRGSATSGEASLILAYWKNTIGIRTIIDLRTKEEKEADPNDMLVEAVYPTIKKKEKDKKKAKGKNKDDKRKKKKEKKKNGNNIKGEITSFEGEEAEEGEQEIEDDYAYEEEENTEVESEDEEMKIKQRALQKAAGTEGAEEMEERVLPYKRYHIPLFTTLLKVKGLFWESSDSKTKWAMLGSLANKNKTVREVFVKEAMNPLGLFGLNKLMLIHAPEQILRFLHLCADERNYPIMFHCSSGKDRTGFAAAMILSICFLDEEDIIHNYHISEELLHPVQHLVRQENAQQGLSEEFDGTPRSVMESTLEFISEIWGSPREYLLSIGFSVEEQVSLRRNLVQSGLSQISSSLASLSLQNDVDPFTKKANKKRIKRAKAWNARSSASDFSSSEDVLSSSESNNNRGLRHKKSLIYSSSTPVSSDSEATAPLRRGQQVEPQQQEQEEEDERPFRKHHRLSWRKNSTSS